MSKKETNGMNFGEISTIRNILMGQQMDDYENRFNELKHYIEKIENSLNSKLTELEQRQVAHNEEIQKTFTTKLDRLEQLLLQNTNELKLAITEKTGEERQDLAQLLAEMSNQLLKK